MVWSFTTNDNEFPTQAFVVGQVEFKGPAGRPRGSEFSFLVLGAGMGIIKGAVRNIEGGRGWVKAPY